MDTIQTDVSTRVSQALWDDPRTSDAVIEVLNKNGVVTLSGIVGSIKIVQAAEEIARAQEGVISVVNELKVKSDSDLNLKVLNPVKGKDDPDQRSFPRS